MKLFSIAAIIFMLAAAGCASAPQKNHATFNIRDFGAIGDGTSKDTVAFQKGLDACAVAGGGEVIVPAGKYLIGSVQIGNRTILSLETNSVIIGSGDTNDYPMMDVRWEGRWQPGRRALIYAANVNHTGIVGPGRIEGNPFVAAPQNPRGAVVLEPISCNDVRWDGFTVTQGGNWATHPTYCSDVEIKNLKIIGNRDGIDVDSCKNVRIEHCDINTGDDSISLKSGRGLDGARIGRPAENILIENCNLIGRRFACIGIGSETSGGIRDVRIENCKMTCRTFGVYIKTRIGRGGSIENICGKDLEMLERWFLENQPDRRGQLEHGGRSGGRFGRLPARKELPFLQCDRDELREAGGCPRHFPGETTGRSVAGKHYRDLRQRHHTGKYHGCEMARHPRHRLHRGAGHANECK